MNNAFSVAIAIDFGTTFSGYAYCLAAHSATGEIYKNTEWTKQVHQKNSYIKTPTHLLYNDGKLEAWGNNAKRRLIELDVLFQRSMGCMITGNHLDGPVCKSLANGISIATRA